MSFSRQLGRCCVAAGGGFSVYHQPTEDCHEFSHMRWRYDECGSPYAWDNLVDVTNGSFDEKGNRIDGYVQLYPSKPAETEECPACGHAEVKRPPVYNLKKAIKRKRRLKKDLEKSAEGLVNTTAQYFAEFKENLKKSLESLFG